MLLKWYAPKFVHNFQLLEFVDKLDQLLVVFPKCLRKSLGKLKIILNNDTHLYTIC